MAKTMVLIQGRNASECDAIRGMLAGQTDLHVNTQPNEFSTGDPLHGLATLPDVLILILAQRGEETLRALAARSAAQRPPMIVIGPAGDAQVMRRAMQVGARDFFSPPVVAAELLHAVRQITNEMGLQPSAGTLGSITAVINAKGGSGASFIAANLAHIAAVQHKTPVALIDLDLQFGAMPLAFDLEQRNSLLEALGASGQLDGVALQGYMAKHTSGVHVLSAMSDQVPLPWEVPTDSLARLLAVARQAYGAIVVDLPRQIDPLTSTVLSQSDHVAVIMQQSLAHVRDAKRMLRVLTGSLGVARDKVLLVVNRHSDKAQVQMRDITETINPASSLMLPNDFTAASESLNVGVPLMEFDRNAAITKALLDMSIRLEGGTPEAADAPARKRSFRETLAGTLKR
jgi:pilus assembly protein CpaE